MQNKVTAQIGSTQITIETGKIAKLADGAVIVSCGETIVLASAVSATDHQGRPGLVSAHGRLPRKSRRRRKISGRLFQTRRAPDRKGNAHLAHDRSAAPAAVPSRLSLRHAGHQHPAQRGWRERSGHSRDQRRLRRADRLRHSVRRSDRRRSRRPRQWPVHRQPDAQPSANKAISISFTSAPRTTSS